MPVSKTQNISSAQIIETKHFDTTRIIYSGMEEEHIYNSNGLICHRIPISYKYADGTIGPLIIPVLPKRFSFGVCETINFSNRVNGHTLALSLFSKNGATVEEKEWVRFYEHTLLDSIKRELVENKLTKYSDGKLSMETLDSLGRLYRKKENNIPVPDTDFSGPIFYPKLMENKKKGVITSLFMDEYDKVMEAKSQLRKWCWATVLVCVESIYVQGGEYFLQVKVYQASITQTTNFSKITPLLPPAYRP
jgi:hypothetical protein